MHWKEITGIHQTIEQVTFSEQEAIRPVYATDPFCLNANCNGIPTREQAVKGAKIAGKRAGADAKKNKTRVCDPVNQEKGRQTQREQGIGFHSYEFQHSPEMQEMRRQNGIKVSQTEEAKLRLAQAREKVDPVKRKILARERALKLEAEGRGLGSIPFEVRSARSKEQARQKWMDPDHPELGEYNAGFLVKRQKAMGYPHGKENRVRVG
jgi:hypothetical protein